MNASIARRVVYAALGAVPFVFAGIAAATEPTHLEPAQVVTPRIFELEEELMYSHRDDDEVESETELSYGINRKLKIGLHIPFEHESGEGTEFGDVGVFMEGVFNPDAVRGPLVGGELELLAPTGDDSDRIGGEIQLRLSKYFGEEDRSGVHFNLMGYADTEEDDDHDHWRLFRWAYDDDEDDDDSGFGAAAGYTRLVGNATTLVGDVYYRSGYEGDDDAVMGEVGVSHEFTDRFSAGLGLGAGLTSDSPDFEAKVVFSIAFGGKHAK